MPSYIPDEYLYASLGHSLGEHGTSAVRGEHAAFPALLQPLLTAPLWLVGDVQTGLNLVKALNAVAMAAAAVPLYLLARRLGLARSGALFCALLGAASPNLYFVSLVLSNPISYPLALGAVVAAVAVLERPTARGQLVFLALAGLATFASIQFIALPAVLIGAAVVVERGRIVRVVRQFRLTVVLLALASVTFLVQPSLLGFYRHTPAVVGRLGTGSWLHWTSLGALLLAVSAGTCFVPGAVAAVAQGIARPRERSE
ncbi:MAG: hypothetical protein QOE29_1310, partial [Gaiellaceae bacterium]|nr:hypothetical protein [Gaiellaceae bacterium]